MLQLPKYLRSLLILAFWIGLVMRASAATPVQDGSEDSRWTLDWEEMRIDSVLPVYHEVVPLETDYRFHDYTVRVLYPEWGSLTAAEAAVAKRFDALLTDSLVIQSSVGVSRKSGLLDISFVPVVKNGNTYAKLLSGKLEIVAHAKPRPLRTARYAEAESESTTMPLWASQSRLVTGKWAKVAISEDGIYQLTYSSLRQMGFNDPSRIRVYGHGGHRLSEVMEAAKVFDDLQEVALLPVENGFLFHANGMMHWENGHHIQNHYAREAYYFISETDTPASAITIANATPAIEPTATTPSTYDAYAVHDPQEYAWFSGGKQLYENYDYVGGARQYSLTLPSLVKENAEATFTLDFTASNSTPTTVTATFNGTEQEPLVISSLPDAYAYAVHGHRSSKVSSLRSTNVVRLQTTAGNHARLNYFELAYKGLLKTDADHPMLQFGYNTAEGGNLLCLEYASGQSPQLWRLAEPGRAAVRLSGTTKDVTGTDGKTHHMLYVALEDDSSLHNYVFFDAAASYPEPTYAGNVENQNLHGLDSLDMVIITPASGSFDEQANRLAEAHRAMDGLRVVVVRADQVYNEFSSGTPDATAYRLLMKMLYDRAATPEDAPRYLLLFGDCAWDNRMLSVAWRGYDPDNYLLCFESENSVSDTRCFVMEDYFGLLDEGEGANLTSDKTDLGVGRFPVRTVAEARQLVDKTIAYMQGAQVGAWKNVVAFFGDDGDNNEHMRYADDVAEKVSKAHPELEVRKIMWDLYPRVSTASGNRYPQVAQLVKKQMDEGALMINYTGHGSYYCLSHEMVMRIEDFSLFSSPRVPLWVTAACDVMPFDTQKDNIGETALLNPNGAAIAFFGTTRTVYAYNNLQMNRQFCRYVFGTDSEGRPYRLGDAVRLAKVTLITDGLEMGNAENKLHYALLGDPALRLGNQANHVVVDSINGQALDNLASDFTLHAGGKARVVGHVEGPDGSTMTDFNGILSLRLYDSKNTLTCRQQDGATTAFTFQAFDKMLYNGQDSVQGGRFSVTCPVPIDISYSNAAGRMLLYAVNAERTQEANGYTEDFLLGGTEAALNDTEGPRITAWLGNEQFTDGDVVGATPFFLANLEDESGISTAANSVGHDLELIIDGKAATTYNLNDYFTNDFGTYSSGSVAFTIPALAEGEHTLLFRAWDMMGNAGTAELTFKVDPTLKPTVLSLNATKSPATSETMFMLACNRPGSVCHFTIEVFDFNSRLLWSHTEQNSSQTGVFSVPWNLTTGSGFPLGSGVYLYRARVSCDDSEQVSKTQKIIINRRK